ncbi:MAG: hypothetical protein RL375_1247, partial [Pseudomonadota bacterium]
MFSTFSVSLTSFLARAASTVRRAVTHHLCASVVGATMAAVALPQAAHAGHNC